MSKAFDPPADLERQAFQLRRTRSAVDVARELGIQRETVSRLCGKFRRKVGAIARQCTAERCPLLEELRRGRDEMGPGRFEMYFDDLNASEPKELR